MVIKQLRIVLIAAILSFALQSLGSAASLEITAIAQNGANLRNNDYLYNNTKLTLKLADPSVGPQLTRVRIELRQAADQALIDLIDVNRYLNEYQFAYTIPAGTYDLIADIYDNQGNSGQKEATDLVVTSEKLALQLAVDKTIWKPKSGQDLNLAYTLSKDLDVTIFGLNGAGEVSKTKFAAAGAMGGKAGYNLVPLDGKAIRGGYLGDGIYLFLVTSNGKVLGKIKIVVKD